MKDKTRVYTREMRKAGSTLAKYERGYTYVLKPCLHQIDAYEYHNIDTEVVCPICRLESNVN